MTPKLEWMEKSFAAFPNCFFQHCREEPRVNDDFSTYRTCLVNVCGDCLLLCDSGEKIFERRFNFKDLANMNIDVKKKKRVEVIAIDAIEESKVKMDGRAIGGNGILLSICWTELSEAAVPLLFFFTLFRMEMNSGRAALLIKEDLPKNLALCRFFQTTNSELGILMFPSDSPAELRILQKNREGAWWLKGDNEVENELPELAAAGSLPGAAIRMAVEVIGKYRWTIVGFDGGHLMFWRTGIADRNTVLIKHLRFMGAVSLLDIYQPYKGDDEEDEEDDPTVHTIVSSTLGPIAVYRVVQYHDGAVSWEQRAILKDSTKNDTVTVCARHGNFLAVGYYSQLLMTYNLKNVLELPPTVPTLHAHSTCKANAPIVALKFMGLFDLSLLTLAGHHHLVTLEEEPEEDEEEEEDEYA